MNKVFLTGNLGKDPEAKTLESGVMVANFTMATQEFYKDREGKRVTKTQWHNIVLWRGLAETASKYLKKGAKVTIVGSIQTRSWDDKEGQKRYITEIVGSEMEMVGSPKEPSNEEMPTPEDYKNTAPDISEKDDLPF